MANDSNGTRTSGFRFLRWVLTDDQRTRRAVLLVAAVVLGVVAVVISAAVVLGMVGGGAVGSAVTAGLVATAGRLRRSQSDR